MPLELPGSPGFQEITWIADAAVGVSESPFTKARQVYDYGSGRWRAIVKIPAMSRESARAWSAFFANVRGQEFYLGDSSIPDHVTSETPTIAGTISSGATIETAGWTASQSGLVQSGTWFDVIAANGKKALFQLLANVESGGSGNSTLSVFPNVRTTINAAAALNFTQPKGVFLMDDIPALRIDSNNILQSFSFECSQVQ